MEDMGIPVNKSLVSSEVVYFFWLIDTLISTHSFGDLSEAGTRFVREIKCPPSPH